MKSGALRGLAVVAIIACGARTQLYVVEANDASSNIDASSNLDAPSDSPVGCPFEQPTVLVSVAFTPLLGLTIDDKAIYWTAGNSIQVVSKNGGVPVTLASSQTGNLQGIVVAAGNVFWTMQGSGIGMVPVAGGSTLVLAQTQSDPWGIAVAEGEVYWTTLGGGGTLGRTAVGGGPVEVLKSAPTSYVGMATDGTHVFWAAEEGQGSVLAYSIATQSISVLATATNGAPWSVATDGTNVYWSEISLGSNANIYIVRASVNGGPPTVLGSVEHDGGGGCSFALDICGGGLATDGQFIYFTLTNPGSVWKVSVGGGTPVLIAQGEDHPYGIAVDDACVYWDTSSGDVMVGPK